MNLVSLHRLLMTACAGNDEVAVVIPLWRSGDRLLLRIATGRQNQLLVMVLHPSMNLLLILLRLASCSNRGGIVLGSRRGRLVSGLVINALLLLHQLVIKLNHLRSSKTLLVNPAVAATSFVNQGLRLHDYGYVCKAWNVLE